MGILDETRFVERLRFFDGQRLFAADLQGIEAFNREMRWLHNSSLHQAGIGNGFAVRGAKGDREVVIGPGYAIDALGREIVLTRDWIEPVPPVAGRDGVAIRFDLTVAYPADADLDPTESREGICLPRGTIRLREQPVFCWVEVDQTGQPRDTQLRTDITRGMRIVLARVAVLHCRLDAAPTLAQRRNARPPQHPHIGCGTTRARWAHLDLGVKDTAVVLRTTVDTSSAGFVNVPCCFARIAGPRIIELTAGSRVLRWFVLDSLAVQDTQRDRFTAYLTLLPIMEVPAVAATRGTRAARDSAAALGLDSAASSEGIERVIEWIEKNWTIVWFGVEA